MKLLGINKLSATTASLRDIKRKDSDRLMKCCCGKRYIYAILCSKQLKLI